MLFQAPQNTKQRGEHRLSCARYQVWVLPNSETPKSASGEYGVHKGFIRGADVARNTKLTLSNCRLFLHLDSFVLTLAPLNAATLSR